jgi:Trypsin-co-occurring domain 2
VIGKDVEPVGISLTDAINRVRAELEQAVKDGEYSQLAFRAGPIELEFEVAFARIGGVEGGFGLSVLSLGAKREFRHQLPIA